MNVETVASEHVATEAFPQAKPKWIRVKLPTGKKYTELRNVVDKYNLLLAVALIWASAGAKVPLLL